MCVNIYVNNYIKKIYPKIVKINKTLTISRYNNVILCLFLIFLILKAMDWCRNSSAPVHKLATVKLIYWHYRCIS